MMRSQFFTHLLLGMLIATGAASAQTPDENRISVFVAKKIYTMDQGWPSATAVAVQGGKVLSVGSMNDLAPWLEDKDYEVVDTFKDKIMMPGFIEPHGHPLIGGILLTRPLLTYHPAPNPYGPDFEGLKTRDEALTKLREYEEALNESPDELLLAWGFDTVVFGGHLDKTDLDKISATRPIIVWDASEHFAYLNTVVLDQRGYTAELADEVNGVQLGEDGELNGQFLGTTAAAFALSSFIAEQMRPEPSKKALDFLIDLSVQGGITTQSDLVVGVIDPPAEAELYEQYFNNPTTPMRLVAVSDIAGVTAAQESVADAVEYVLDLEERSTEKIIFRGVKSFSDDSFLGFGMMLENPGYTDERSGIFITEGDDLVAQLLPFWQAGLQIHVHTNGNAGNDNTLAALAELQKLHPRFDHRFTFEHYGISTPAQAKRLAALGAVASVNPYYLHLRAEINTPYVGTDRSHLASRYRTLLDAGVPTTMHSDTPIGPAEPLEWAWIAVNRFGLSGKELAPAEQITVPEALRMITIDAAYVLGVDDLIGSIEPGKFADFTVLDDDPYEVLPESLRDVPVWATVVGGQVTLVSDIAP